MPKNRKKSGKRKSLRELFKIGPCMSPETISPEIDGTVQNDQDNDDIEEKHSITDVGDASKEKSYSDGDTTNTPEYNTDLAEQNKYDSDGDITPEQSVLDEQNRYNHDVDSEQKRCMLDEIDHAYNEDDNISIGACSLSNSDVQIDFTPQENHDTLSKSAGSLSGSVQRMNITPNKENDTSNKEDGYLLNTEDSAASIKDDGTSIGAWSLSDADEQMARQHIDVKDDLKNSNDSGKHKDAEDNSNTSLKTGLYIDPMVMDSRKEILLNLKTLIEQNVKQIKDMAKCKAQLNIAVHKAELRVDRTKKSNDEMKVKITALRADFWMEAKQFPATVSLKVNKCDNWVRKRKQDIVDDLNTVKRKEKLLKEFIPKLKEENDLRKTWTPTVPIITFSPVIAHLNLQFFEEFGTIFRFKKPRPGIYFRHPFYRTTYHVAEEKLENFKEKHPYFYYHCQRYIKKNDDEVFQQQTEDVIWYDEKKQGLKEIKERDTQKHVYTEMIENKEEKIGKGKAKNNGASLKIKNEDTIVINKGTCVKTEQGVTNTDLKATKKKYMRKENNNSTDRIVQNKSQAPTKTTRKTIVESKLNVDKDKATQKKVTPKIAKQRNSSVLKIKTDTSTSSKEITKNDNDKGKKTLENMVVDTKILERIENLRKQGKDAFLKTSGDKSFIYIKPAASQGIETGSGNNRHLVISVTKRGQSVSDAKVVRKPPSAPIKHADLNRFGSTKKSNFLLDNIRVHAKPVPVKGKTKIPLFIRQNVDYKTKTPRKPPNSNVPSPRIHFTEKQSKRGVIQRKRKTHGSEPTVSDAFDNKAKADHDKSNMDRRIPVSRNDIIRDFTRPQTRTFNKFRYEYQTQSLIPISVNYMKGKCQRIVLSREPAPYGHIITRDFTMPQKRTFNKFHNKSKKQRQSLIPISVNYMKESGQRKVVSREPAPYGNKIPRDQTTVVSRKPAPRDHLNVRNQNKDVFREPTPYDHIISKVIGEYMPWSDDDEDDAYDNPEGDKDKPENSHHDNITVREKENNRTKETLKTKVKVKTNTSLLLQEGDNEPTIYGPKIGRDQSKDVSREPTPYDHIISQVIGEYMPWSDEEDDDAYDKQEVENMPKTSNNGIIPMKEKENQRTKGTLEAKDKVKANTSLLLQEEDNGVSIEPTLYGSKIVRDQNKDVSREPTPYDHIISQVIGEYLPWSDDEDDNPEVNKDKPENSYHDTITVKEKENNRTKEKLKTEGKVKTNLSLNFLEDDKAITKKSRNVIVLPPITPTLSPTKRARSRSERCKSYISEKQDKSKNDSLAVNVNSTLNGRNSVSVTVPKNSVTDTNMSGKSLEGKNCRNVPRPQEKKNEMGEIVPHPPESPKDTSKRRGRKFRIGTGKEIEPIAAKISKPETNITSAEALLQHGIQSTANLCHDSFHSLSKGSAKFAEHAVSKSGKTLLETIDEKMLSSVMDEQFNSHRKSLRGQSELVLPPIRNH